MPRRPRLFVSGGIYHVYCRTHRGEFRFDNTIEAEAFLEAVFDVSRVHGLVVVAWCLMSNHYHLVVRTTDVKLWRSMARIHGQVTRAHNRRHLVFGPGWQCRYRARLIQNGDDLRHLLAYVHLNPMMARLVHDPADYRLSGHRAIIGHSEPILTDVSAALRCFKCETEREARQAYLEFVRCVAEAKWAREPIRKLPWWKPATDDHQTVSENDAPPEAKTFDNEYPHLASGQEMSIENLVDRVAPLLGSTVPELAGQGKRRVTALARRRFTMIAASYFDHTLKSIASALGKSSSQVSRWLGKETEECYVNADELAFIQGVVAAVLERPISKSKPTCA